ncbi:MAG: mechanosensitive ion channel protein [Gemmatimonadales bacterium]|nr:MAG: mechanosensitive ion channel protein [Gemmatimonadales bacterium]
MNRTSWLRRIHAIASAVALACIAAAPAASAQESQQVQPAGAPVVVRGDTLFRLTGTLGPFTPEERAAALAQRIDRLARDPLAKAADVVIVDTAGVTDIKLGDVVVMTVTERDAAEMGTTRQNLAAQWAAIIQEVIRSYEGEANLISILLGILYTILATAAFIFVFRLLNRFFPAFYAKLESWRGTRIRAIRIQRMELISASQLTSAALGAARIVRVLAVALLIYIYLPLVFSFFPWTRGLANTLFGYVLDPLKRAGTAIVDYLPNLFAIAVIALVVRYLLKFIRLIFEGVERGTISFPGFYRDWAEPTYKIVRFLVIVFALIMIYPYLPGAGTAAFQGVSIFMGVLVSLGSAGAIANIVAGVVMTYMRPFSVGDRVKIADTVGDVVQKTLLVTRVRTIKNVDITIPNAMVLASHIINYSSSAKDRGLILHTSVTIGYDAPWRKVHETLIAAAVATEGILKEPKPFVLQTALNDFYVSYELNAYTDRPNEMARIYSELHQNIQDKFNEAGIEIMSPHYTAVRDGNQVTIPADYLPKDYQAPGFKIFPLGNLLRDPGPKSGT